MKRLLIFCSTIITLNVTAQKDTKRYPIVPRPASLAPKDGTFTLDPYTVIILGDAAEKPSSDFLNDYLARFFGFKLKIAKAATKNFIKLGTKRLLLPGIEGKYDLQINATGINISGDTYQGTFYGVQTIIQLLPVQKVGKLAIPCADISDQPAFRYRGLHLDAGRHFMPVDFVKKYIDYLVYFKLNTFHWHLTEDQGWRIEIKKYPLLTTVGAWRDGTLVGRYPGKSNDNIKYGGFYTQQEVREIVQYAKDRYVTVIPEIEMPGHSSAAIAAYPQLSCFPEETTVIPTIPSEASKKKSGKKVQETWGVFEDVFCPSEYTFKFLQDVIDEVITLFPAEYIHIGGDECPKESWKRSAFCQQLIKEKNLKDEHGLQSYFIQRMEKYINDKGRKIIGWDEILEGGLAPNATVMSWRSEQGGIDAAKQGHDVIMTPGTYCYFDHSQSKTEDSVTIGGYLPIETVYSYHPVPAVLSADEASHVLGAQANLWTEYIKNTSKVEYMVFPRLAALSEVLWTKKESKSWDDFEKRLPLVFSRLDFQKINYSRAYYAIQASVNKPTARNAVAWTLSSRHPGCSILVYKPGVDEPEVVFQNTSKQTSGATETSNQFMVTEPGTYLAKLMVPGSKEPLQEIRQTFAFNKATAKEVQLTDAAASAYPGNGSFTLTDGVQNSLGLSRSIEFLGFNGKDCEAVIDLGKIDSIRRVTVHIFLQKGSWIYLPKSLAVSTSIDGKTYSGESRVDAIEGAAGSNTVTATIPTAACRFLKVKVYNYGTIPGGQPGAGNPAWLFVDEIEAY